MVTFVPGSRGVFFDGWRVMAYRFSPHPKDKSMDNNGKQDGSVFLEFRRKVREAEVLSGSMERLLSDLNFSGRVSVIVHNGRVLKSGYEEGYFTRRNDARMV